MRTILLLTFAAGTLLDFFVTMLGMNLILGADTFLIYLISAAVALTLTSLRLCKKWISNGQETTYQFLKSALVVSVIIAFYASFIALVNLVFIKQSLSTETTTGIKWAIVFARNHMNVTVILLLITIYLVSSPLVLTQFVHEFLSERENELSDEDEDVKPPTKEPSTN